MVKRFSLVTLAFMGLIVSGCSHDGYQEKVATEPEAVNILFLHHSTGNVIYNGLQENQVPDVEAWMDGYNQVNGTAYHIHEESFPKGKRFRLLGYGWKNYPFDYYNIWVKNGDKTSFEGEPTLKTLTPLWDVVVFKHCFPFSGIATSDEADIESEQRTLGNYKLQYEALKLKLKSYPDTKFVLWTGAALTEANTSPEAAQNARLFVNWVKNEWDEPNDNIFLWDFYELQTEGGLYLKDEFAASPTDSHPNAQFAAKVAPLFCNRLVDVIQNKGQKTTLQGSALETVGELDL